MDDNKAAEMASNIEAVRDAVAEMNNSVQELLTGVNELVELVSEALS